MLRRVYSTGTVTHALGQILESRQSFLKNIDARVREERLAVEKQIKLDKASQLAHLQNRSGSDSSTQPAEDEDPHKVTLRQLMQAGLHLGHSTSKWCPRMAPFIYGSRNGIHIVDLEKTLACLRQACQVVSELASKGALILFVGTKPSIRRLTYECAMECQQYYVNQSWTGGTLTNAAHVLGAQMALYNQLGADTSSNTATRPHLLVLLDYNEAAVREAVLSHLPTIAIVDTDKDPTAVTYPIPGNDDAFGAVEVVGRMLAQAAKEGKAHVDRDPNKEIIDSAMKFARDALDQQHPTLFY